MQSTSSSLMLACFMACFTSRTTHRLWCAAVSLGRKPVPGGETKVCLRFDRICAGGDDAFFLCCDESSSECALSCGDGGVEVGCKITPTPNLLAEPSSPIAIGMLELCWSCSSVLIQLIQYQKSNFLFRSVAAKACEHHHESWREVRWSQRLSGEKEESRPSRDREFWEASTLPLPSVFWLEDFKVV